MFSRTFRYNSIYQHFNNFFDMDFRLLPIMKFITGLRDVNKGNVFLCLMLETDRASTKATLAES